MKKILTIIGLIIGILIFIICSMLIARASYISKQEKEKQAQEELAKSISNLKIVDIDKLEELFKSGETQIIFVGSLNCQYCSAIKPKINELAESLDANIYYFELSTLTEDEERRFYNINEFLSQGTSIPLVMAVKDNKVIDSFVGNIEQKEIEIFLKNNLGIE